MRRALTIARHDGRILARDPATILMTIVLAMVLMAFTQRAFHLALTAEGYRGVNGSEQAVPGMTIFFATFMINLVGIAFFREHGWHTWDRLRSSEARASEILAGKFIPPLVAALVQLLLTFALGAVLFRLDSQGPLLGVAIILVATGFCIVAIGTMGVAIFKTYTQAQAFCWLFGVVMAGLGGAIVNRSLLPAWAKPLSPLTPAYWSIQGMRGVILDGHGVGYAIRPSLVLLGFTALFLTIALASFRFGDQKRYFA